MDKFLLFTVCGIIIVVTVLLIVLVFMVMKDKNKASAPTGEKKQEDAVEAARARKSIFKFMEFDNIEDNMIVQDGGKRYLMVIECKGVNYDLLSGVEKNAVEQGFLSFLNALKFEVQLYVQTRKVNLAQSTQKYRERLKTLERDMLEEEQKYQNLVRDNSATKEDILKELKEVTKKRNLYEYGKDVIENTEQMSQDSDLTTKEYYIVVPYYTDEITSAGEYDKREIGSMAFSELYTRAQSLVGALTECEVRGRILSSKELIELLFISYNREQHDTYDFEEYIGNSGFDSFYSVSQDVLEKRIQALDEEISRKAREKAVEAYRRVNRRNELMVQAIKEREEKMKEYVNSLAEEALDSQAGVIDKYSVEQSKKELAKMDEEERKAKEARAERIKAMEEKNKPKSDENEQIVLIEDDELEDEEVVPTNSGDELDEENKSYVENINKNVVAYEDELDEKDIDSKENIPYMNKEEQKSKEEQERLAAKRARQEKLKAMTPEQRAKLAEKIRRKKMLKEMEAKKNGEN